MNALRAEARKLLSLPAARFAAVGTVAAAGLLTAALAGVFLDDPDAGTAAPAALALGVVPYIQAGAVLCGILPVAQEYAGRQIATTLAAVPRRATALAAKALAALALLVLVAVLSVVAAWGTALLALSGTTPSAPTPAEIGRLAGAALYLALIGLLSFAVALAVRQLVPALVGMLALVFLVPTALAALGEHVRWLPGTAGSQLYATTDTLLRAGTGGLVLLGWVAAAGFVGSLRFLRADA